MNKEREHDPVQVAVKKPGTILVVDDDDLIRNIASSILLRSGYNVITAESGIDGISIFRTKSREVNAVLLDVSMPGKSGPDTMADMLMIKPDLKVLMTSGSISPDRIDELKNAGASGFIGKPFSVAELSDKIRDLIS